MFEFDARENLYFRYSGIIWSNAEAGYVWFMDRSGNIVRPRILCYPTDNETNGLPLTSPTGMGDICVLDYRTVRWSEKSMLPY